MSRVLKAMADPRRLKIISLLSCGAMCACDVLEHFEFTQPTLSHHMKVLEQAKIVTVTKDRQWHYYELNEMFASNFMDELKELMIDNEKDCICHHKEINEGVNVNESSNVI